MITIKWMYFLSFISFNCCNGQGKSKSKSKSNYSSNKIIGGKDVAVTEHPYLGTFEYGGVFRCTVTLLVPDWLSMPGDCISEEESEHVKEKAKVRLGSSYRLLGGYLYLVNRVEIHPYFPRRGEQYNVAITQLNISVIPNYVHKPVSMLNLYEDIKIVGLKVTIAGFGKEKEGFAQGHALKEAVVDVVPNNACKKIWDLYSNFDITLTDSMFCTWSIKSSPCVGDNGGPAIYNYPHRGRKLIGFMIRSSLCELPPKPAIFIRISRHASWIAALIEFYKRAPSGTVSKKL